MATINLGNIKFKWQGAYNGATAYTVDDVVSYNGSSYICTANSTGNLPTNTSYWDQMSSAGTNGTNGTDLTTTLTTQGDLVYRDGSGLQRLGAGTAGQVLQTGGAGANPSWGTVSSDYVKIADVYASGSSTELILDNIFSADYNYYKVFCYPQKSATTGVFCQFRDTSPATVTNGYYFCGSSSYQESATHGFNNFRNWNGSYWGMNENIAGSGTLSYGAYEHTIIHPFSSTNRKYVHCMDTSYDGTYQRTCHYSVWHDTNTQMAGLRFYTTNTTNFGSNTRVTVYGMK